MIPFDKLDLSKLKTGDIILHHDKSSILRPNTWVSYLIRLFTDSFYNHTSEVLVMGGEVYFIEALSGGITINYKKTMKGKTRKMVSVFRMKNFNPNNAYINKALKELNKKYDYFGIVWDMLLYTTIGKRRDRSKAASETRRWCSEFNAWMKDLPGWQKYMPKDFSKNKLFEKIV